MPSLPELPSARGPAPLESQQVPQPALPVRSPQKLPDSPQQLPTLQPEPLDTSLENAREQAAALPQCVPAIELSMAPAPPPSVAGSPPQQRDAVCQPGTAKLLPLEHQPELQPHDRVERKLGRQLFRELEEKPVQFAERQIQPAENGLWLKSGEQQLQKQQQQRSQPQQEPSMQQQRPPGCCLQQVVHERAKPQTGSRVDEAQGEENRRDTAEWMQPRSSLLCEEPQPEPSSSPTVERLAELPEVNAPAASDATWPALAAADARGGDERTSGAASRGRTETEPSPIHMASPTSAAMMAFEDGGDRDSPCSATFPASPAGLTLQLGLPPGPHGLEHESLSSDSSATVPVATFGAQRWEWPSEEAADLGSPRRSLVYSRTNSGGSPSMRTISSVATPLRTPVGTPHWRGGSDVALPQSSRPSLGSPRRSRRSVTSPRHCRGSLTPPSDMTPPGHSRGSLTPPGGSGEDPMSPARALSVGAGSALFFSAAAASAPPAPRSSGQSAIRAASASASVAPWGRSGGAALAPGRASLVSKASRAAAEWHELYLTEVGRLPANADQLRAFVVHRGGNLPYYVARRALQR